MTAAAAPCEHAAAHRGVKAQIVREWGAEAREPAVKRNA
jgi:hypothetical protein